MIGMPAIVIGDHGNGGVADLRFAREFGLGHIGHANDFKTQLAMHMRFGQRGKLRPFHADIRAAAMDSHLGGVASSSQNSRELPGRPGCRSPRERRCRRQKKWKCGGRVRSKNWSGIRKSSGFNSSCRRADRAHGDQSLDAQLFHGVNIGAVVDFRRKEAMPARVTGEEGDALALERSDDESIGGIAERRLDAPFAGVLQARHGVEAAAADDADAVCFVFAGSPDFVFALGIRNDTKGNIAARSVRCGTSVYYNRLGNVSCHPAREAGPREYGRHDRKERAILRGRFVAAISFYFRGWSWDKDRSP